MTVSAEQVRRVIDEVPDPEMPVISVGALGMVADVRVRLADGGVVVEVDLVPTYSACPATRVIREDVERAVGGLAGVSRVAVVFVPEPVWTPQRISAEGRAQLRTFGIAPPGLHAISAPPPPCPYCGSDRARLESAFGPTPCRSTHYCPDCRNPFEAVKP